MRAAAWALRRAAEERRATGCPSEMEELADYLHLPLPQAAILCSLGTSLVAARWRALAPSSAEEVRAFYAHCSEYLYDLVFWHLGDEYRSLLGLLAGEVGGRCLTFGGGTGSEALLLARQGNEVWYLDVPGSPVWRFAMWRAQRWGADVQFVERLPERLELDCVVAFNVFGSLMPHELAEVLPALAGSLRPGGRLYCNNDFRPSPSHPYMFDNSDLWDSLTEELSLVKVHARLWTKGEGGGR
ncbi:MAG TPA: class I SAM-dependent methyltransferase [Dehalococcoidia bacterium]|nr:class I SAM-dependent methyltransferase [Dehalococcoidia bacterium]